MSKMDTQVAVSGRVRGVTPPLFWRPISGLKVTLIDPEPNPGGVCLYRVYSVEGTSSHRGTDHRIRSAKDHGVVFGSPKIQTAKLRSWKNDVVAKLTGGLGQLVKQRRIPYRRAPPLSRITER